MYRIGQEEIDAVARVINSRNLFKINDGAREVYHFEEELKAKHGIEIDKRKFVEKMITYGKKSDLVARRKALAFLHNDKEVVNKIFNELAPRYAERQGGYTRIIKLTERKGDDALQVRLELVD